MAEKKEETKEVTFSGQQLMQNFEMHKARLQQINQRMNSFINAKREFQTTLQGLEELKKGKESTIKVLLGSGVFADAKIEKPGKVTVSLPNNILIEKTTEDTIKELNERITETEKAIEETRKIQGQEAQQTQFFQNLLIQGQQFIQKQREQKK
ncbi:MAG: prefoldin subunit alpha [Candidatus Diapherotrites archaeon]|nr:prefoldin subunit alpha [Candidatus Diapherotrites archaeon]